jgi:acyl-CoA synthetase (AMP-forming)/AMP-acid ligase II/thioesterase domain-containing protein/acyl carrier protein
MEKPNVTTLGALAKARGGSATIALIGRDGFGWSMARVHNALDSLKQDRLSGRIGVLIDDRLLSGLASGAVIRQATCVPLDPKMTLTEVQERIDLLGITTIIVDSERWRDLKVDSQVRVQLENFELKWTGEFRPGEPSEDALILMTSGSTGKPKVVRLSHENLVHSTGAIISSMNLNEEDRAINMLPMAHIGGLVDLFLVPLISGGSVVFVDPTQPKDVLSAISAAKITWLQGAPAILQSLLRTCGNTATEHSLRLIRSVSAPLSNALYHEITNHFGVPVIEMYGMSETGGVITSNPPGQGEQKVGSVGKPVNCEVTIQNGGEVWVQSAGLFRGYQNEEENEGLWKNGAFFTGDLGYLDGDGYLFLTGRAKEQINRGGQKVAPREIDQLVEAWPEITEAASFGFPHSTLGEEVGLALVFKKNHDLCDQEIRERLSEHLTDYKLPKRLVRIDKLPRNQGGKLQRHLLAEVTAPTSQNKEAPLSETEKRIVPLWQAALGVNNAGRDLDFFDQGGDSLSATTLLASVEKTFKISLLGFIFYENATIGGLARAVDERRTGKSDSNQRSLDFPRRIRKKLLRFLSSWPGKAPFPESYARIDDRANNDTPYLFWCCNSVREISVIAENARSYLTLVSFRTLRLVQHKKLRNYDLITQIYLEEIERLQPTGPVHLGGFCEGARIMVRIGRELIKKGRQIQLLVLQDFNLEDPFPARIAMIHSAEWKRHPVRSHHDIHLGWRKIYQNRYGLMEKDGNHSHAFNEESQKTLRQFLKDQLEKSGADRPTSFSRQNPQCSITLITSIPRVLKSNKDYPVRVRIRNEGSQTIASNHGVVLHARWVDLNRDPKPGLPMFTPLSADLEPGEATELEINLISRKGKRIYQIQIAILEEGWGWQPSVIEKSHRQWRLII